MLNKLIKNRLDTRDRNKKLNLVFKTDPLINSAKKNYVEKYTEYSLTEHRFKKRQFLINTTYVTYKPRFYRFYLNKETEMQLRLEEWIEIEKDVPLLNKINSIKNNTSEGEGLEFTWE